MDTQYASLAVFADGVVAASLDQETDMLVMRAIHTHFKHATCIIVAHRLHTIITCDKCIVADKGRVVEYDSPHNLLTLHRGGVFDTLVEACGPETSQALRNRAAGKWFGTTYEPGTDVIRPSEQL